MEEAILGQRESDDDSLESDPSTRVTDLTDDSRRRDEAKRRFARKQLSHVDEKKSSDSISVSVRVVRMLSSAFQGAFNSYLLQNSLPFL